MTIGILTTLATGEPAPAARERAPAYPWELVELAPGVLAAIQPDGSWFDDSNSVVVAGPRGALVIDAQTSREAVLTLIARIEEEDAGPVRRIVNTHWHGDHTQGNALYRERYGPGLEILGHRSLQQDVPERAAADLTERVERYERELPAARERLRRGVDREGEELDEEAKGLAADAIARAEAWLQANRDARFLAPGIGYTEELLVDAATPVRLIHFRGHTRGDTVAYLPEERILVAGDLVDVMPFLGHGYPAAWAESLRRLLELPIERVVPGHGPVLEGKDHMRTMLGYLEDLVSQVQRSVAAGLSLEETIEAVDTSSWRDRLTDNRGGREFFDQVQGAAIERAWTEATEEGSTR